MNTIKSIFFVLLAPVALTICFHTNQLKSQVSRGPAVETKIEGKSVKNAVKGYLLAVNNLK